MDNLLGSTISGELIFVYGLIALVIVLIVVIIAIDKRESKKKPQNLFDTLNMKIIADPYSYDNKTVEDTVEDSKVDVIEVQQQIKETDFHDLEPIPEVQMVTSSSSNVQDNTDQINQADYSLNSYDYKEQSSSVGEEAYVETDLEKTQAQIRVEEITNALKNAQVDEQIQEDKYAKFEEEQEKNAIISYNELKKSFDKLYSENEKIQYLEDDEIPINIDELYQFNTKQEELPKVKLEDFSDFTSTKSEVNKSTSTFKSSPLISPVYGIQEPPVQVKSTVDVDIQNANQFLQSLKELKSNLD